MVNTLSISETFVCMLMYVVYFCGVCCECKHKGMITYTLCKIILTLQNTTNPSQRFVFFYIKA